MKKNKALISHTFTNLIIQCIRPSIGGSKYYGQLQQHDILLPKHMDLNIIHPN